jgi:hypothetical protein
MAGETHPRVLVLTQNKMQPFTGGGVVLATLFDRFPSSHVMFLHRDVEYDLRIPYESHRLQAAWLRLDARALLSQIGAWTAAALRGLRQLRKDDLAALVLSSSWFHFPAALDRRIRDFKPDIIYAWTADALWSRTLEKTAARYGLPYVIHFMDNHFEAEPSSPRQAAPVRVFREKLSAVARRASILMVISDVMGRAYQAYWGRPYEVYRGANEVDKWPWPGHRDRGGDPEFRFAFTGSADRSQLLGLANVAAVLDRLAAKGRQVRLVLYLTPQYEQAARAALGAYRSVEYRRHPEASALRAELLTMDALVLSYGFDTDSIRYYKYSFATKMAAYMLSGRPILAHGPMAMEPIAYAVRDGWAHLVDEPAGPRAEAAYEAFIDDERVRQRLARTAWDAGVKEHDREAQAARFAASLRRAADAGPVSLSTP